VNVNPNSQARDFCVQFLYQCETLKVFHFSDPHFKAFVADFSVTAATLDHMRKLAFGTLDARERLDDEISAVSKNWTLGRMGSIDRIVLRMATYELLESDTPTKVVLNEAVELAKKYGGDESSSFVNGVLDAVVRRVRQP
jgi:transcription antitermination protein NusB